jgi:hypothetical protein
VHGSGLNFFLLGLQLPASVLGSVTNLFFGEGRNTSNPIIQRILALGSPLDESANDIIGVISTASIELSQSTLQDFSIIKYVGGGAKD